MKLLLRIFWFNLLFSTLLLSPLYGQEKVESFSTRSFIDVESKWPKLEGQKIKIEGRYSSISTDSLRMMGCDILFYLPIDLNRPRNGSRTIEVTGKLQRISNRWTFQINHLRSLPSDLQTLRIKERVLTKANLEPWYELAKWATQRAEYYEDKDLAQEAVALKRKAISLGREKIEANDGQGLIRLSEKVEELKLADSLKFEILHEGLSAIWENSQKKEESAKLVELQALIRKKLPGSITPLEKVPDTIVTGYSTSPIVFYNKSAASDREKLHRIFYRNVSIKQILGQAKDDGSNGDEIASSLSNMVPEISESLQKEYYKKWLAYRLSGIKTATRQEALALSQDYKSNKQDKESKEVIQKWLSARKARIRKEDQTDVIPLSEDYVRLLNDIPTARLILIGAWKDNKKSKELQVKLNNLGMKLYKENWLEEEEYKKQSFDPIVDAMNRGIIKEKMTRSQVFKTLGNPTQIIRVATAEGTTEQWTYEDADVIVSFEKQSEKGKALVKKIDKLESN